MGAPLQSLHDSQRSEASRARALVHGGPGPAPNAKTHSRSLAALGRSTGRTHHSRVAVWSGSVLTFTQRTLPPIFTVTVSGP